MDYSDEQKEAINLAYSRRSKEFDLERADSRFKRLMTPEEQLQYLQDVLEDAYYDLSRINEIIQMARNEIASYGNRLLLLGKIDVIDRVFTREYLSASIGALNNRLIFLRSHVKRPMWNEEGEIYRKLNGVYYYLHRRNPQSQSALGFGSGFEDFLYIIPKMRNVVEYIFPVPWYELMFTEEQLINRSHQQYEQDRTLYARARDHETRVFRYLFAPITEEDLKWNRDRTKQWNDQINIIHRIERDVFAIHEQDYLEAERSFYEHAARQSFYDTANRMSSQPGQPRQSIQPRQRRYSDYSADPNYQGL